MIKKIILIILIGFLIFGNYTLTISNTKKIINIEYNGLLWVGLDYYSIWKYKSLDIPIKWLKITKKYAQY